MSNNKQTGIILITVLLFLFMISLLVMYEMQFSLWQMQMARNDLIQAQNFSLAQTALKIAFANLSKKMPACLIAPQNFSQWQMHDNNWWLSNSICHGQLDNQQYQYVVERLQVDACTQIMGKNVQYWRITVHVMSKGGRDIQQATVALPTISGEKCTKDRQLRILHDPWQSWLRLM